MGSLSNLSTWDYAAGALVLVAGYGVVKHRGPSRWIMIGVVAVLAWGVYSDYSPGSCS